MFQNNVLPPSSSQRVSQQTMRKKQAASTALFAACVACSQTLKMEAVHSQFLRANERKTRRDKKITIFWYVTSCSMVKVY
jgi:hypothetical protein